MRNEIKKGKNSKKKNQHFDVCRTQQFPNYNFSKELYDYKHKVIGLTPSRNLLGGPKIALVDKMSKFMKQNQMAKKPINAK